jgi:AcrR family transcriptional regulator
VEQRRQGRHRAVSAHKRALILEAARHVFQAEGLEGASLRAIAAQAGYAPAALYSHFDSKEAIYAEVLQTSLAALGTAIGKSVAEVCRPEQRLHAAAMAFFGFYAENPCDLDLGFYLLRGGMRRAGLGRGRDEQLNAALEAALSPITAAAEDLGASEFDATMVMVDIFAHAAGLLLLLHTGRIRIFGASAAERMEAYVQERMTRLRQS